MFKVKGGTTDFLFFHHPCPSILFFLSYLLPVTRGHCPCRGWQMFFVRRAGGARIDARERRDLFLA